MPLSQESSPVIVYEATREAKNKFSSTRTRHIDATQVVRDAETAGKIEVTYVRTRDHQHADMLTNTLGRNTLEKHMRIHINAA